QYPEFQRANNLGLMFLLDTPNSSENLFSEQKKKEMIETYKAHRSKIERELKELPNLFRQIDEKLNESTDVARSPEAPKQIPGQAPLPPEKTLPKKQDTAVAQAENRASKPKAPATRTNPPASPARKSQQSRLPPPSENLIAQNKLSNQNQSQADVIFSRANDLLKKGDDPGALKLYRDALKLNPEFAEIYKRIGMIYMKRKESDRAIRSFKLYLQLKPNSQDKKVVEGWISSLQ
ncbi:MAG: tetratricopeptide repeat protein, partial [Bdellovibrionota bacterium]